MAGDGGDADDEVEVLVQVQHGKPREFSSGGNQQVGNRRRAVLALACQCQLDLNCSDAETARNVGPFHLLRPGGRALRAHRPRPRAGLDHRTSRCPAKPPTSDDGRKQDARKAAVHRVRADTFHRDRLWSAVSRPRESANSVLWKESAGGVRGRYPREQRDEV